MIAPDLTAVKAMLVHAFKGSILTNSESRIGLYATNDEIYVGSEEFDAEKLAATVSEWFARHYSPVGQVIAGADPLAGAIDGTDWSEEELAAWLSGGSGQ